MKGYISERNRLLLNSNLKIFIHSVPIRHSKVYNLIRDLPFFETAKPGFNSYICSLIFFEVK